MVGMKPISHLFNIDDIDFSSIDTWIHGLLAAAITAAATSGTGEVAALATQTHINWASFGISIGMASMAAAFFYLKTSPLPKSIFKSTETTETPTTTTTKTVEVQTKP